MPGKDSLGIVVSNQRIFLPLFWRQKSGGKNRRATIKF